MQTQYTREVALPRIENLRTEYLTDPLGLDVATPRFSWNMISDERGAEQRTYRITVFKDNTYLDDRIQVWDSGEIESSLSVGIVYEGELLLPSTRYVWKVTIKDNREQLLSSKTASFETGLMNDDGISGWMGANWITNPGKSSVPASQDRRLLKSYDIYLNLRIVDHSAGFIFSNTDNEYLLLRLEPTKKGEPGYQMGLFHGTPFGIKHYSYISGAQYTEERKIITVPPIVLPDFDPCDWHTVKVSVREGSPVINIAGTIAVYLDGEEEPVLHTRVSRYGGSHKGGIIGFYNPHSTAEYKDVFIIQPEMEKKNIFGPPTRYSYLRLADLKLDGLEESFVKWDTDEPAEAVLEDGIIKVSNEIVSEGPISGAPMFRKEFRTEKVVESARLYSTGGGITEFHLNGKRVGDDYFAPGYTDYNMTFAYQTYDVTELISGYTSHALGVVLGNGWYSGSEDVNYKPFSAQPIVMARLLITYTDGTTENIVTDDTWQYCDKGPITRDILMDGVTHDYRRETALEGWATAAYCGEELWKQNARRLSAPRNDKYGVKVISTPGVLPQQIDVLNPLVITNDPVDPARIIVDFGQNMVGNILLKVRGGVKGNVIRIRYGEMLNDRTGIRTGDGPAGTLYTENYRTAKSTDYFMLSGSDLHEFSPRFTFHGFRYVEITGYPGVLNKDDIRGLVISSAKESSLLFECSNPQVNRLQRNIEWGMKGNFFSVPTDCPQRDERMGWTGDAQIFARTAVYTMNVQPFFTKWMMDLNDTLEQFGFYSGLYAPFNAAYANDFSGWWTAWSDVGIVLPYQLWQIYGDQRVISENYNNFKTYMDYVATRTVPDGFVIDSNGFSGVGDHVSLVKTSTQLVATAYYALTAKMMSEMANAIGRAEDAFYYGQLFNNIKTAFGEAFIREDGVICCNGDTNEHDTQTAYAMALNYGLIPDEMIPIAAARLVELGYGYQEDGTLAMTTGFLGTRDLCPALSKAGQNEAAYDLLLNKAYPSWLYTVEQGATTMWERWNSYTLDKGFGEVSMNSFNHYAFGAVGEWIYNYMVGIQNDPITPGFKHFLLEPAIDPKSGKGEDRIQWAKGEFYSVYGLIRSSWHIDCQQVTYEFTIPANSTATVKLQGADLDEISENGLPVQQAVGILEYNETAKEVFLKCASGSYRLSYLRK